MIDSSGFRAGVGAILVNKNRELFWAKRTRQKNAWQFPQGGLMEGESPVEALYRELYEEIGLLPEDIRILAESKQWLSYRLPKNLLRRHSLPLVTGQNLLFYLLELVSDEDHVCFDRTNTPEFTSFRWVNYWHPLKEVIAFKRHVYHKALNEFSPILFP
ncbi:MAG: RNA pyrophosphohydrolase [Pseudomonadota bacterium]